MKKLSKIRLQNAVVLEERDMKMIFGGSGGNGSTACEKTSSNSEIVCDGLCAPLIQSGTLIPRTCTKSIPVGLPRLYSCYCS